MGTAVNLNGTSYTIPAVGEDNWGTQVSNYLIALATGVLTKAGGSFTLTADADFGANFGLKSGYYKSRTSNISTAGIMRLANNEGIGWRNAANGANKILKLNASDILEFDGAPIPTIALGAADEVLQMNGAGTAYEFAKINNANVAAAAAIAVNKLAALTASKAVASDGSGFLTAATTTATELDYLSGVTSSVQTQIDSKLSKSGGTMTGDLVLAGDPDSALKAATKQYVDALLNGIKWKSAVRVATTAAGTLATDYENGDTVDGIAVATNDRILLKNQASGDENGIYIVAASGAPTRALDADAFGELNGAAVMVLEGTANANKGFMQTAELTALSDAQTWTQNFGTGLYTASEEGLTLSGSTFSLALDGTTLSKSGSGLKVNEIANAQIAAAAAIAVNKLAALTASKAVVSDGSGFISASSVTSIELGRLSGVGSTVAGISDAAIITNKDFDGGTASDSLRITLPKNTTTNLNALSRKAGTVVYDTDTGQVKIDNGSALSALATTATATPTAQGNVTSYFPVVASGVLTSASATINVGTTDGYQTVLASHTSDQTINLPAAANNAGRTLKIVKTGSGGTVTIDANSTELINGAATQAIYTQYGYCEIACDGTGWYFTAGPVEYGTYTPTVTNQTNIAASTAKVTNFKRVGKMVDVSGMVMIDASSANLLTRAYITLPIASDLANNETDLHGTGTTYIGDANDPLSATIIADTSGNRAEFVFPSTDVTSNDWVFNFTYIIK